MKDTIQEIKDLNKKVGFGNSQIVIDLFEKTRDEILEGELDEMTTLYYVENLLEVFNPAKKEDIEILEQLQEKLNRLTRVSL